MHTFAGSSREWEREAGQLTLDRLKASEVVVGCGLREADIRLDGWPRATAQPPAHPGWRSASTTAAAASCTRPTCANRGSTTSAPPVERGHRLIAEHGSEREPSAAPTSDGGGDCADVEAVSAARRAAAAA